MEEHRLPIDVGWAWVITFACSGMFGFVTGSFKSQGVIIVELKEMYPNTSPSDILWIFSMSTLMNRLSAPLNGLILTKTSHRFLGLLGVSLLSASLVSIAYVPRLEYMYPIYGITYGLGAGMVTLTTFTAYGPYFKKRRALSLGLTAAGSGVLTMIIPAILRCLFDSFTFSGAILLFSGLCVQLFILASLLRPMSFYERLAKSYKSKAEVATDDDAVLSVPLKPPSETPFRDRSHSLGTPTELNSSPSSPFLSTPDISQTSHQLTEKDKKSLIITYSLEDISSCAIIPKSAGDDSKDEKESKLNWRLVYHPQFFMVCLATLMYVSGLSITYQCIPLLGDESGVSKKFVTYALIGAGGLEVVMRSLNGMFADLKIISACTQATLCMAFSGVMAVICAIVSKHAGIILMLLGTSTTGTSVISLLPIVSVELLGKDNLYSAMSINYFYQGLSLLVSTFSSGAIYKSTERWGNVFFFIGGCNLLGAFIMLVTVLESKRIRRHRAKPKASKPKA